MARELIGNVEITQRPQVDYPVVTTFTSIAAPVFEMTEDKLEGVFNNVEVDGDAASIPRWLDQDEIREYGIADDQQFAGTAGEVKRVLIAWKIYRLDKSIKRGQSEAANVMFAQRYAQSIASAQAKGTFQAFCNAAGAIEYSDLTNEDHALGVVGANFRWDAATKARAVLASKKVDNGTGVNATGWNLQKALYARTLARRGWLGSMGMQPAMCVTSHAALDGFYNDEQSLNRDYTPPIMDAFTGGGGVQMADGMWNGFNWVAVGDLPAGKGLATETVGSGNDARDIEDSYVFDPTCFQAVTLRGQLKHELRMYHDENSDEIRFRYKGIYGIGIVNPKGVVPVRNLVPSAA